MSCKSAIYTAMTTATTATAGSTIPLGTVIRRFGCNCQLSGNGINVEGTGYYDVDASITVDPVAAGTVTVTLYKDGVAVPGATASASTSVAGNPVNLSIPALIRLQCCNSASTLTFVISGVATSTITNVGVVVEKT